MKEAEQRHFASFPLGSHSLVVLWSVVCSNQNLAKIDLQGQWQRQCRAGWALAEAVWTSGFEVGARQSGVLIAAQTCRAGGLGPAPSAL